MSDSSRSGGRRESGDGEGLRAHDEGRSSGVKTSREEALKRFHDEDQLERVYDFKMVLQLLPFLRSHRAYIGGSLILLVTMAGLGLVSPLVMRDALQRFEQPGGAAELTKYGFIVAGLMVVKQILAFPQMYWMQLAGARSMADLRRRVFKFLHTRSLGFFDRTPIGRLVTRVTNDVDAIGEMFSSGALNAVGDLIKLVAIVAIMLTLNWKLSLFAFAVLPFVALVVNWTRRRMRTAYRQVRAKTARINAFVNEQVSGIGVVQAYAREQATQREFDEINYVYRSANVRAIMLDATLDASIEMVGSICIASILWYIGFREMPGLDFGTLFAFVVYIDMFFMPVRDLSARYTQIQSALAGAERVLQLLASEDDDTQGVAEDEKPAGGDWPNDDENVAFALDDVSFSYKVGTPVLGNIDLKAARGEIIAVVGPTGSGKSTVASLLLRLYSPQSGVVRVFGREVSELNRATLRRQFAVVPQDVFLFPGTIASNIAAGAATIDRARVEHVLAEIGALDLFERRADGLDTEVQERGGNFSAGERQLIAFARALYRNPPIMILDEPTANIDSDTEARMQRAMTVALKGRTALIIAHRLSTIRSADRIVCLHQGVIVEQGSHEELLQLDGVYARLHRLQATRRQLQEKMTSLSAVPAG